MITAPILANRRPTPSEPSDSPLAGMCAGHERALREGYCDLFAGQQEAYDVACGKRAAHLIALRPARRAQHYGIPKAQVMAFYHQILAMVAIGYPEDEGRTLVDAECDAEEAASRLTIDLVRAGHRPTTGDVLTIERDARALDAAVCTLEASALRLVRGRRD